jgi:hypothetical protein
MDQQKPTTSKAIVPTWLPAFLSALRETGVVRDACEAARVDRTVPYALRKADPVFASAWDEALQDAADLLEREAVRRARVGIREPVIYQGRLQGVYINDAGETVSESTPGARLIPLTVTRYSDVLLMFLLKKIRPEFRDHQPSAATTPTSPVADNTPTPIAPEVLRAFHDSVAAAGLADLPTDSAAKHVDQEGANPSS